MDVVIFANGQLGSDSLATALAQQADLIIAVDGGANHCQALGITPAILLGDLDSIDPALLRHYERKNVSIHRYPADKDKTDLELAIDLAVTKQATRITILAALGGRWDMSFANLLLLATPEYAEIEVLLVDGDTTIGVCHEGKEKQLVFPVGTTVSLLPFNGDVTGVTLSGFKYLLQGQPLRFASSRGVSNILTASPATIVIEAGTLLWIASTGENEGINQL